jgi:hypothetical protein
MSIVSCPRCGDKVSLPPAASATALVQCPLCLEEYFLSDALIQLPPMLKVVGGHASAGEKENDYRLAEPVAAAVGASMFDTGSGGATTVTPRPQLRTVSRPRRQEKSAIGEVLKVVLGGVAGLAGGLLVLWWGFGVDVGDLGPRVSKVQYLRFLVPPKLWDNSVPSGKQRAPLDTLTAEPKSANGGGRRTKSGGNAGGFASDFEPWDEPEVGSGGGLGGSGFTSDPAEEPGTADGRPAAKTGGRQTAKKKVDDDPFTSLEDIGAETKPASDPLELKIDDPLQAVTPPKTSDSTESNPDEPPVAGDDSDTEKPEKNKPSREPAEEDEKDTEKNPSETPAENNPAEEKPAAESDTEKDAEAG